MARVDTVKHDCLQKENIENLFDRSIPAWVRAVAITLFAVLFGLFGGSWLYGVSTYATKESVKDVKTELKETRNRMASAIKDQSDLMREILIEMRKQK